MSILIAQAGVDACRSSHKSAAFRHLFVTRTRTCGLGLFTSQRFFRGDAVLRFRDPLYTAGARPYAELQWLGYSDSQIFQVGPNAFIPPHGEMDDFTNHSCEPNCGLRVDRSGFVMIALRDIGANEELTYDYSTHLENPYEAMMCLCGAKSCRRRIRSFSALPADLQARYLQLDVVGWFARPRPAPRSVTLARAML